VKFLAILERALQLLGAQVELPRLEVDLNRKLYFFLLAATAELCPSELLAPAQEMCNQPDPDDQSRASREQKRPDFQWIYRDRYEADPYRSSKQFVVECKRLGAPPRPDWVLNVNYVEHGIWRFTDATWAYAKRFQSGAMVGYWQSMDADDVLNEVNLAARTRQIPEIVLPKGGWKVASVTRLEHLFPRSFPTSPFRLDHFWADLRGKGAG